MLVARRRSGSHSHSAGRFARYLDSPRILRDSRIAFLALRSFARAIPGAAAAREFGDSRVGSGEYARYRDRSSRCRDGEFAATRKNFRATRARGASTREDATQRENRDLFFRVPRLSVEPQRHSRYVGTGRAGYFEERSEPAGGELMENKYRFSRKPRETDVRTLTERRLAGGEWKVARACVYVRAYRNGYNLLFPATRRENGHNGTSLTISRDLILYTSGAALNMQRQGAHHGDNRGRPRAN